MSKPLVTAVIPTRNRPELVCRAVRSALAQTYANLEIVVVIDGPDPSTVRALEALNEPRLRIVALEESVGGSEARNIGVREAEGEWIALLDDDDEWFPQKTELQMQAAVTSLRPRLIFASQFIDRSPKGDLIRPQRFQKVGQAISDYLFCEVPAIRPRQGFPQTSTLLAHKSLLSEVPFSRGLRRNQESDWLLRAAPKSGGELQIIPSVLAIFNNEQHERISRQLDWRDSYTWCVSNRQLFTDKSFSYYLAAFCLPAATRQKEGAGVRLTLMRECFKRGEITPMVLWFFLRHAIAAPLLKRLLPNEIISGISKAMHK
jgi:glycosyltransferase involved in cell wall biosynthesis